MPTVDDVVRDSRTLQKAVPLGPAFCQVVVPRGKPIG
jgi:hypothetical protein